MAGIAKQSRRVMPLRKPNFGGMYANGWGVPRDLIEAVKWRGRAAAHGDETLQAEAEGNPNRTMTESARMGR